MYMKVGTFAEKSCMRIHLQLYVQIWLCILWCCKINTFILTDEYKRRDNVSVHNVLRSVL